MTPRNVRRGVPSAATSPQLIIITVSERRTIFFGAAFWLPKLMSADNLRPSANVLRFPARINSER